MSTKSDDAIRVCLKFLREHPPSVVPGPYSSASEAKAGLKGVDDCLSEMQKIIASGKDIPKSLFSGVQDMLSIHLARLQKSQELKRYVKAYKFKKHYERVYMCVFLERKINEKAKEKEKEKEKEDDAKRKMHDKQPEGNPKPKAPPRPEHDVVKYKQKLANSVEPFSGDVLKFEQFLQHFNAAVHETDAKDGVKFAELMRKLPYKDVGKYQILGAEEYASVMDDLKHTYRNPNLIQQACHARLSKLEILDDTTVLDALWSTYYEFTTCMSVLVKDYRNLDFMNTFVGSVMTAVFPRNMVTQCLEGQNDHEFDCMKFSKQIETHLKKLDTKRTISMIAPQTSACHRQVHFYNESNTHEYDDSNEQDYEESNEQDYDESNTHDYDESNTPEYDESNEQDYDESDTQHYNESSSQQSTPEHNQNYNLTHTNPKTRWLCFFCQGEHNHMVCTELSPSECLEMVKQARRCTICAKYHTGVCYYTRICFNCNVPHIPALCPKRDEEIERLTIMTEEMPFNNAEDD